jgi:hypothetical protein
MEAADGPDCRTLILMNVAQIRMRPVDGAVLALLVFEIPSILFSQYRANSVLSPNTTR